MNHLPFSKTLLILSIVFLSSCSSMSPNKKSSFSDTDLSTKSNSIGANIALVIGFDGTPVAYDTASGKPILSCADRKRPQTSCKSKIVKVNGGYELIKKDTKEKIETITIKRGIFTGSHCESLIVGGKLFENCKAWEAFEHVFKTQLQ